MCLFVEQLGSKQTRNKKKQPSTPFLRNVMEPNKTILLKRKWKKILLYSLIWGHIDIDTMRQLCVLFVPCNHGYTHTFCVLTSQRPNDCVVFSTCVYFTGCLFADSLHKFPLSLELQYTIDCSRQLCLRSNIYVTKRKVSG